MTLCPDCLRAEQNALYGGYSARCFDCRARSVANGPAFFATLHSRELTKDFRALLARQFPEGAEAGFKRAQALVSTTEREDMRLEYWKSGDDWSCHFEGGPATTFTASGYNTKAIAITALCNHVIACRAFSDGIKTASKLAPDVRARIRSMVRAVAKERV